jgi:D-aminopeptidase
LLTGTLSVPRAADGLITYMLSLPGMENVRSINPLVGETNDGYLSDIRTRPITEEHVRFAIEQATTEPTYYGCLGAGAGTRCFGFKGGIGTASRKLPEDMGGWTVGVLVQTNFGGILTIQGKQIGPMLDEQLQSRINAMHDGSIMIVLATDAPLSHRNLRRMATRTFLGMARTGGYASNGSGDYAIAFSTHPELRIRRGEEQPVTQRPQLDNNAMSMLFLAAVEATEEAIIDSLFTARTTVGYRGTTQELPVEKVLEILGIERQKVEPQEKEEIKKPNKK